MDFPLLPRSSDSKLDGNDSDGHVEGGGLNRKRRSKAKSMEALNHQNKDNSGGGSNKRWGSGIWSWLTRSRERMDSADSKTTAGDTEDEEVAGGTTTEEEKGGGGI